MSNKKIVVAFDLDDTLCFEEDFLISAYKEIASYIGGKYSVDIDLIFNSMLSDISNGYNVFEVLHDTYGIDVDNLLSIYRNHFPSDLIWIDGAINLLQYFQNVDAVIGIITDGREITQNNKIEALKIYPWIADDNIIISEVFGSEKPSLRNYNYFVNKYPEADLFIYIGDNVSKDFITPNKLGWITICLLDSGRNIHKQNFDLPDEYLPSIKVESLWDIPNMIKQYL